MTSLDSVFFDFFRDEDDVIESYSVQEALLDLGYTLGSDERFLPDAEPEAGNETESEAIPDTTAESSSVPSKKLTYVQTPSTFTPSFQTDSTVEITGTFPDGTTNVRVNGYVLKTFSPAK